MKHILMVDDVATNLRCATEILKDQYEITAVKSGEKAMEALESMTPDLVLLDINMPGMNGFEVFERIRKMPELLDVPIVFLTAQTDKDIEIRSMEMGAADFIKKPYEPDDLSRRIAKVFQNSLNNKQTASSQKFDVIKLTGKKSEERLRAWADSPSTNGYFILLNLNHFEQLKAIFGTVAENEILKKAADVLNAIPDSKKCFCHITDNVFATYLDGSYDMDSIKAIIRRMIAEMEFEINESISEEFELKITVTAGIASKPEDGRNYTELRECADKALYFVKESGRKKYHFYHMKTGEVKEGAEEKETINLLQLKYQFENRNLDNIDSLECIKKAYHVVSKYWETTGGETQIIHFSIEGTDAEKESIDLLSEVIAGSLRKGDAAVKCGRLQYITVLLNTSAQNGEMVARRIKKKFEEKTGGTECSLVYEMKQA